MSDQKQVNTAEQFLHLYNELDAFMRKTLGVGDEVEHTYMIQELSKRGYRAFADYGYELRLFARLRNAIVHNPYLRTANPIAEPHQDTLEKYRLITESAMNPPKALAIAIPGPKIFTATLETNVQQLIQIIIEKSYTHIPVIEEGKMIGVFSENTLFTYIARHKDCIITQDFTMKEFIDFIPLEKHLNEYFEFVPRNVLLYDVEEIFKKGLKDLKRIAVVYITEHGKPEERLLGMITSWDLAGK